MSYRLDKEQKERKIYRSLALAVLILSLFYFRGSIYRGFSAAATYLARPVWTAGIKVKEKSGILSQSLGSKKSLVLENENLKLEVEEIKAKLADRDVLADENIKLKQILERRAEKNFILGVILSKPNRSIYDTLIIDAGSEEGIKTGQKVYAYGTILLGSINEVYADSSKVKLYSTPGEKINAVISGRDIYVDIIGRGGGNFEMTLPRDTKIELGTDVVLPGISPRILAIVGNIVSDPRDPFQKLLLASPVNIQELKFVQVEK